MMGSEVTTTSQKIQHRFALWQSVAAMKATTEIASDKEKNNVQKQKHKRQGFLLCIY